MMNIYVSNLSFHTSEEDLNELFSQFGQVISTKIIKDNFSGRSKGFAFVEMTNTTEAENAITQLNQTVLNQRTINVKESKPREENRKRF